MSDRQRRFKFEVTAIFRYKMIMRSSSYIYIKLACATSYRPSYCSSYCRKRVHRLPLFRLSLFKLLHSRAYRLILRWCVKTASSSNISCTLATNGRISGSLARNPGNARFCVLYALHGIPCQCSDLKWHVGDLCCLFLLKPINSAS